MLCRPSSEVTILLRRQLNLGHFSPFFWQILAHNILVVMAIMFPEEFTPENHVAMDKFLGALARALSEKYR